MNMVMLKKKKFLTYILAVVASFFVMQGSVLAASSIRITELMYNPSGNGDREFVEFYNGDNVAIDMSGWYVVGVGYTLPSGSILQPKQYAVIVRNYSVFSAYNGSAKIFGQYPGKLKSGGELVRLVDGAQNIVSQLSYQSGGSWPSQANDGGPSLSLIRLTANESLPACWAPSSANYGTPGYGNSVNSSWVASHGGGCSDVAYATTKKTTSPNTGTNGSGGNGGGDTNNDGSGGGTSASDGNANSGGQGQNGDTPVSSDDPGAGGNQNTQGTTPDGAEPALLEEARNVGVTKTGSSIVPKVVVLIILSSLTMLIIFASAYKKKLLLIEKRLFKGHIHGSKKVHTK